MADDTRGAILEATVACVGRVGLARMTVDEAAREAGVARATVYRYFPGGRDQLVSEAITWEVGRFFTHLAEAVAGAPDFATVLERGLIEARRTVEGHVVLQKVIETEPERLLPHLTTAAPMVLAVLRGYFEPLLEREDLRPGVDAEAAADWLARNVLSFIVAEGSWDISDPVAVRRLVRGQLLAGVLAPDDQDRPGIVLTEP